MEKCATDFVTKYQKQIYTVGITEAKTVQWKTYSQCTVSEDKQCCLQLIKETRIAGLTATQLEVGLKPTNVPM